MPKLVIQQKTGLKPSEAFTKVKAVLNNDSDLKRLDPSYTCKFDEDKMTGVAHGKLFKANMQVRAGSNGSEVELHIDLPLTLALFKGMVESTLKKKLEDSLA